MPITECFVAFHHGNKYFKLTSNIPCQKVDSFSPIFAISTFITKYLPQVSPPLTTATKEEIIANTTESFNPMYEAWNQHLIDNIILGSAYRINQKFYILVSLTQIIIFQTSPKQKQILAQVSLPQKQEETADKIYSLFQIFGIQGEVSKKRVGMYFNEPVTDKVFFTPRINTCANLLGNLFNNQAWKVFDIPKGAVPSVEELASLDAVLVTGSSWSVHDKNGDMQLAINNLATAIKQAPHLKVLGICYGHQLILQHYGAHVVSKQSVGRLQTINIISNAADKYASLTGLKDKEQLVMTQCHEDFVETVPLGFQLLASSKSCKVEATVSEDGRILTTQFHGEMLFQSMERLHQQMIGRKKTDIGFELNQTEHNISSNLQDSQLIITIMTDFLS